MTKLQAFAIDLIEGAIIGAAIAALALPDGVGDAKAATVLIVAGAIGGLKAVARASLSAFVASRKPSG
jgi:hypothetical protein